MNSLLCIVSTLFTQVKNFEFTSSNTCMKTKYIMDYNYKNKIY